MNILETLDNRTILAYLLSTEVPFKLENGYLKSEINLFIDRDFINNEELRINGYEMISNDPKKEEIIKQSKEILENIKNLLNNINGDNLL